MLFQNFNSRIYLPVLVLVFALAAFLIAPMDAQARMYRTSGSGMAEGDPGDGLDSDTGGGSSGGSTSSPITVKSPAVPDPASAAFLPVFFPVSIEMVPVELNGRISFVILIDTSISGGHK